MIPNVAANTNTTTPAATIPNISIVLSFLFLCAAYLLFKFSSLFTFTAFAILIAMMANVANVIIIINFLSSFSFLMLSFCLIDDAKVRRFLQCTKFFNRYMHKTSIYLICVKRFVRGHRKKSIKSCVICENLRRNVYLCIRL